MADANRIDFIACAFWTLALSVALLPVGLGGDRPIPLGLAQGGLALSCLFLASSRTLWAEVRFFSRIRWAFGFFGIVVAWAFIQTQPYMPDNWIHPLWQEAAAVLTIPVHGTIAISPEDSLKGLTDFITYVAAGLLAYILAQNPARAQKLVQIIWLSGATICGYGLIIYVSGLNKILWFDKWTYLNDLTATFVNRNHFAIYAGMAFVCGMALLLQSWERDVLRQKPRIRAIREWLMRKGFPQGFLLAMVFLCILLSHSRAGLVLTVLGLGGYFFFHQIYARTWRGTIATGIFVLIGLTAVLLIAMQFSDRFVVLFSDYSSLDRMKVYKLGLHALQDNPWLGYGLNGFEPEFRLYQQTMIMEFNHAHNDILESLLDLGIPVGLLLWTAVGLLLSGLWHGIKRRRQNGLFPALGLATSLMGLGHAFVDFDLQIPGVAVTWAVLLGAGLAQSWPQAKKHKSVS